MTIKEASKELQITELFLREWIASGSCPFGVMVQMPHSSRRTFYINEGRMNEWNGKKKSLGSVGSD